MNEGYYFKVLRSVSRAPLIFDSLFGLNVTFNIRPYCDHAYLLQGPSIVTKSGWLSGLRVRLMRRVAPQTSHTKDDKNVTNSPPPCFARIHYGRSLTVQPDCLKSGLTLHDFRRTRTRYVATGRRGSWQMTAIPSRLFRIVTHRIAEGLALHDVQSVTVRAFRAASHYTILSLRRPAMAPHDAVTDWTSCSARPSAILTIGG